MSPVQQNKVTPGILVLASAVLLGAGLVACGGKEAEGKAVVAQPVLELAAVDVAQVRATDRAAGLTLSGSLQAVTQTTVQSRVAAEVHAVLVREGESVKKGQLLARLGSQDLEARLRQAEAGLASAKVEADLAQALLKRNQALYEKKYFSEVDYQRSVGEAEARAANVRAQQSLVDIARKALQDASVLAPQNGIIAKRYIEPGSSVNVDGRLFDLVDLSELELAAPVPATEIAAVAIGQSVVLEVSGLPGKRFNGKVVRINPVADSGTRAITVYVRLHNPGQNLRGGMYAHGQLQLARSGSSLSIPLEAVHESAGAVPWVLVLEQGHLQKREIAIAARDERSGQLLLAGGLKEGEVVVMAGLSEAAVKQAARISR